MDFISNMFKKKEAKAAPSSSKPSKSTLSNSESKQVQGIMKARACELCGNQVKCPSGFCLPVKMPPEAELLIDMRNLHALIDVGLLGAMHQRLYNYFACEQCVNKLHQSSGVTPDKLELEMARNKARYLWDTDIRERTMRPDEFPYPVSLDLSLLSKPLAPVVGKVAAIMASTTDEEEKILAYTNVMARELQFQRLSPFSNQRNPSRQRHVAIVSELRFLDVTEPPVEKFIQRWLLKDIGKNTIVYYSQYKLTRWFSYRMASGFACGIAENVPEEENSVRGNLSYECYVNTNDGHCMAVFWD